MKTPINDAATQLHLHPCELVLALAGVVGSFEEIYPRVDEGFLETVKQMYPKRFNRASPRGGLEQTFQVSVQPSSHLSADAERIVAVLAHKRHWGTNVVSEATLRNRYCRELPNFDAAVKELLHANILSAKGPRGPFSLNPKAKGRVREAISGV